MSSQETPPVVTHEELVAMVSKAHHDSAYGESTLAGKTLAASSRLPRVIAENLGAGFGQWSFFPEPAEIVDFACRYAPPSTEDEVWAMARAWAEDDAAERQTLMALVGREILQHELRRIEVPKLRELFDEVQPERVHALRTSLGLAAPAAAPVKATRKRGPTAAGARPPPAVKRPVPERMPKPAFVRPPKAGPAPPAKRFTHPKFGEGVLERQEGAGDETKLTIKFAGGSKTLLARYVTEV